MTQMTRRTALALIGGTALSAPFIRRARAEGGTLNVYNWADYIGETTIEDFTSATGIEVTYDLYSSAEEMQAKMLAGSTGYDVVDMAGGDMPRLIKAGIYDKLDRTKFKNYGNLDPEILKILRGWDPDNSHGIPYMWGSVGMTYNLDMVNERLPGADLNSLDMLFKPENAKKLADCGISVLDSPGDTLLMVLKYIGVDPDKATEDDYKKVAETFKPIRQYIRTFDNSNYLNAVANKELCAINNWSGDYATTKARAAEAGVDLNLAYFVPKTGSPAWVDCLCIPADAANKDNAYIFLDYMMQPEVIAKCTNFTNYANGNLASRPFIDPEILKNPAVYPDKEMMDRLWAPNTSDEQTRLMNRYWTQIKAD